MDKLSTFIAHIVQYIIQPLLGLLFALALFFFAGGVFNMLWKSGDPKALATGKRRLAWGVVGLFIMVSAVSILAVVTRSFCNGHVFCVGVGG